MSGAKREDIQGLRAMAIIMVLMFHFYPEFFPNGYVGVDIFFVISGFLMCMILSKHSSITFSIMRKFYNRRIQRIFPLYYATILFILTLIVTVLPDVFAETNPKFALKAIMLITNIKNDKEDTYQLEMSGARNLFTHTWSLCVELQFYLIVPLIMITSKSLSKRVRPELLYLLIGSTSFIVFVLLPADTAFNSVFARMWQFQSGFLAYEFSRSTPNDCDDSRCLLGEENKEEVLKKRPYSPVLSNLAFLFLFGGMAFISINSLALRIVCTLSTAVLIQQGSISQLRPLTSRCLFYIGEASYSIYLIHWPIYIGGKVLSQSDDGIGNSWTLELALIASVTVGFGVHFLFEKQYLKWSPIRTYFFIVTAVFVSIAVSSSALKIKQFGDQRNISDTLADAIKWNEENAMERNGMPDSGASSMGCVFDFYKDEQDGRRFGICPKGEGNMKILILGNSYARNQLGVVYKYFRKFASEFMIYYNAGCGVLSENTNKYCDRKWKYGFEKVAEEIQPDVIFMIYRSGHLKSYFAGDFSKDPVYQLALKKLKFYENITTVRRIYMLGALPIFVPSPVIVANKCLKSGKMLKDCRSLVVHDEGAMKKRLAALEGNCQKCKVYDPIPSFIDKNATEKFVVFDERNRMFVTTAMHFTELGLQRFEKVYADLEPDFREHVLNEEM